MISVQHIEFIIDGQRYEWNGGLGSTIASYENRRNVGDVRYIGKHPLKVFMITRRLYGGDRVCWCSATEDGYDWVRQFKAELLGLASIYQTHQN